MDMIVESIALSQLTQLFPKNISSLTRMHNRLNQEDPAISAWSNDSFLSNYRDKLIRDEILVLVGREDDREAGYAWFQDAHGKISLKEIFLLPPLRTKGRYAGLIKSGLEWMQAKNASVCHCSGLKRDLILGEALLSCGFILVEEHILMQTGLEDVLAEPANIEIRSFSEVGDPGWLLSFIQECLECRPVYDRQDVLDVIKRRDNLSFVAFEADIPTGFLIGETHPRRSAAARQPVFYVEEIGVHPAYRRRGTASSMLAIGFTRARQAGLQVAHLHVVSSNLPGLRLYQKLGFKEIERTGWWEYNRQRSDISDRQK